MLFVYHYEYDYIEIQNIIMIVSAKYVGLAENPLNPQDGYGYERNHDI